MNNPTKAALIELYNALALIAGNAHNYSGQVAEACERAGKLIDALPDDASPPDVEEARE